MELKPSIIARLMGLDDMPNQHEAPTRGKVLSEKYFRKVAFIGVRERSRSRDRSSSVVKSPESSDEYSELFFSGVEKQKKEKLHRNLGEVENLNLNFVEPLNFKASVDLKTWGGREENQKTEEFSSHCSSRKLRHGSPQHELNVWRDYYFRESEGVGQRLQRAEEVEEMKFKSCLNTSSLQISERWKMVKDFQHMRRQSSSGRGFCWTLGEMLSMHDHDHIHGGITCPFLNKNPCEFVNTNGSTYFHRMRIKDKTTSHSNRSQVSGRVSVVMEEDLHQGRMLSGSSNIDSHSADVESNSTMPEEIEVSDNMELPSKSTQNAPVMHKEVKKKKQQQRIWDLSWAKTAAPDLSINFRSPTTYPTENTTTQDELIVIHEESLVSSDYCSDTESFKESSQHSPYSVLEPFQDSPPSSHSDDISDMQFHPFSKLTASSTSTEEKDNSDRVGKNRDFRYLSNVLTEAGFLSLNLIQCFGKWHSTECPINPLVFETLEKKEYAGEKSWRRSERKLLFDRINFRLYEIYHQYAGFFSSPKPVSTMMSSKFWYEVTEELLWKLLVDEQDRRKNSSATVIENDFELLDFAEYVDFIAGELEDLVVDELAAEFLRW